MKIKRAAVFLLALAVIKKSGAVNCSVLTFARKQSFPFHCAISHGGRVCCDPGGSENILLLWKETSKQRKWGRFVSVSPGECVRGLSKCPKTFVFYARDVRAGRWRRNALPVTNAGKSSNTSRLSDITKAAVVDPEAKPHVPLQNTAHERRSQRGGTRKSIRTKNLDTSVKMEKDKPKPKHPTPTCRFSTLKNREQSSGKRTFLFL